MIIIAEAIEEANDPAALEDIKHTAVKQLRMISVSAWPGGEANPTARWPRSHPIALKQESAE